MGIKMQRYGHIVCILNECTSSWHCCTPWDPYYGHNTNMLLSPILSHLHSLHFNGHFPGEPGLAGVYWNKGWWRWWCQLDHWSEKPQSNHRHQQTNIQFFTGWMPFLSPNQQCQSTEGNQSTDIYIIFKKRFLIFTVVICDSLASITLIWCL